MTPQSLVCAATSRSPEINFDYPGGRLVIRGKSYPEDSVAFYVPVLNSLKSWLAELHNSEVTVDLELVYFNSSSAKALMNLLMLLEDAAAGGNKVTVNWHHAEDDDTMREYGEEFAEDLVKITFNLVAVAQIEQL